MRGSIGVACLGRSKGGEKKKNFSFVKSRGIQKLGRELYGCGSTQIRAR